MRYFMLALLALSTLACSPREYYLARATNSTTSYHQAYFIRLAQEADRIEIAGKRDAYFDLGYGSFYISHTPDL